MSAVILPVPLIPSRCYTVPFHAADKRALKQGITVFLFARRRPKTEARKCLSEMWRSLVNAVMNLRVP